MWDKRYDMPEYAYGTQPNDFLRENSYQLPKGKILSLAEGEGRNAVFLATQGYQVTAVDSSQVGLDKARRLADQHHVNIECVLADLVDYDMGIEQWHGIIAIFCPLPSSIRKPIYQKMISSLKPEGVFLSEAYRPEQINYGTGGGDDIDTMQSKQSLIQELTGLQFQHLAEIEREVIEGIYHTGNAAVVQAIGVKSR